MSTDLNDKSYTLSDAQYTELEDLLAEITSVDTGFALLGKELGASATGEDPEKRGRVTFNRRLSEIRSKVCEIEAFKSYCGDANYTDSTTVAALVAGALLEANFAGMNVLLVSCIIARIGLRNLCDKTWTA